MMDMLKKWLTTAAGAIIYGAALGLLLAPNGIAPGGVGGISVILSDLFPIGVGTFTVLLNLPLMIISLVKWGWRFLLSTAAAIVISGISADLLGMLPPLSSQPILAAVFGGAAVGAGCSVVFKSGSTTGGTDIISRLLKLKYPYLSFGTLILMLDGAVALLSGIVYRDAENAMYSAIALFISTRVMDAILYGSDSAKMILVISRRSREITYELLYKENVGCTILKGVSGYSGTDTGVLLCAMKKQSLPSVRERILACDRRAFILVTSASQIFGEGFKTGDDDFY